VLEREGAGELAVAYLINLGQSKDLRLSALDAALAVRDLNEVSQVLVFDSDFESQSRH